MLRCCIQRRKADRHRDHINDPIKRLFCRSRISISIKHLGEFVLLHSVIILKSLDLYQSLHQRSMDTPLRPHINSSLFSKGVHYGFFDLGWFFLFANGANIDTHSANSDPGYCFLQVFAITDAPLDVETGFPRFGRIKGPAREGIGRTTFNTASTITAPIG